MMKRKTAIIESVMKKKRFDADKQHQLNLFSSFKSLLFNLESYATKEAKYKIN
jgi:hypothetical protein